jgi:hypothetical protein
MRTTITHKPPTAGETYVNPLPLELVDEAGNLTGIRLLKEFHTPSPRLDLGDAPDPTYPTRRASDGARHIIAPNLFLGRDVDPEADGQPMLLANGDDDNGVDDEDGVALPKALTAGRIALVRVTASAAGFLDAFVDFNRDGDWRDANEKIFDRRALVAGVNTLQFQVPTTAVAATRTNPTFARFRFSSVGGLSFDGLAVDGEVEDYPVQIKVPRNLQAARVISKKLADALPPLAWKNWFNSNAIDSLIAESRGVLKNGELTERAAALDPLLIAGMTETRPAASQAFSGDQSHSALPETSRIDDLLAAGTSPFDSLLSADGLGSGRRARTG